MATVADTTTPASAIDATPTGNPSVDAETSSDPFEKAIDDGDAKGDSMSPPTSPQTKNRRMSKEWDASKVPPSQFQKRKGSIYATPSSRDAHVKGSDRDKAYFEKLKEKGWNILKKK